ncbi:MAG TPA: hypothetical protein VMF29_02185 [Candidatus Edwardsbacteria bacterium]|nr:hypothetical protein [Candidatus Edwardsbacteria bacterium]
MSVVLRAALGAIAGGAVGFLYYKVIGCRSGACPIAGNMWVSTLWWALIGGLLLSGYKN